MNDQILKLMGGFVTPQYVHHASQAKKRRENLIRTILAARKVPQEGNQVPNELSCLQVSRMVCGMRGVSSGLDAQTLELFLHELSALDTNNFTGQQISNNLSQLVYRVIYRQRHILQDRHRLRHRHRQIHRHRQTSIQKGRCLLDMSQCHCHTPHRLDHIGCCVFQKIIINVFPGFVFVFD